MSLQLLNSVVEIVEEVNEVFYSKAFEFEVVLLCFSESGLKLVEHLIGEFLHFELLLGLRVVCEAVIIHVELGEEVHDVLDLCC